MPADGPTKPLPSPALTAFRAAVGAGEDLGAAERGAGLGDPLLGECWGAMTPLEASSGAALDSRQRPPSTLPRAGADRGRLRYHPLALGRQWGAVPLGGRPVGTVLGRCGATAGDYWRSRGFAAIAQPDLASVDFGRFRPKAVGLTPKGLFHALRRMRKGVSLLF